MDCTVGLFVKFLMNAKVRVEWFLEVLHLRHSIFELVLSNNICFLVSKKHAGVVNFF